MQKTITRFLDDNTVKYLLSKGAISLLFRSLGVCFGFLVVWLLSYFFKEKVYGSFSLSQTVIQLLAMIFTLGVQNTIIVEVNKFKNDSLFSTQSFLLHVIKLVSLVAILPMLLLYFFAPAISSGIFHKPHLWQNFSLIALFLPVFLLHEVVLYYFIGLQKFLTFGLFMFVVPNVLFVFFILITPKESNESYQLVFYYALSFSITLILEITVALYRSKNLFKRKFSGRKTLQDSLPMMFSGLMAFLISWTDILMLGVMSTEESVGIYNAAFKVGMFVIIIIASINIITGPRITEFYSKNDLVGLKRIIQKSTQLATVISLPIVLVLSFCSTYILHFFGSNFTSGYLVLIMVAVSTFISAASGNVDQILNLTNNKKLLFRINVVVLVVNVALNYLLIPIFDINGSAFASMIATILLNFICIYFIKKQLGFYTLA